MEPVEIDITLKQNVSDEAPKVTQSMSDITKASEIAKRELQENIKIQKKVISELEAQLKPLEKQIMSATNALGSSSKEREKIAQSHKNLVKEIDLEKKALQDLELQSQQYGQKQVSLETQIRIVREEMARLKLAGQEESEQYQQLQQKLGLLGTAYREVFNQQKALSSGGTQMAGILSGLSALSGAIGAGIGAIGLFNDKSEEMQKIQTKIQSLMSITIGLQQISTALHQTSAFRITTLTKIKELWAVANLKVATTLGITTAAAQVLMATLTFGLSIAITAIVVGLERLITKNREATQEQKKMNESASDSASKLISDYSRLQKAYKKLGDDLQAKQKFINENQKAFNDLGVAVNTVNDADNLFISNTNAFKEAIIQRALAAAAMDVATEKFKKAIEKQIKADQITTAPKTKYVRDAQTGQVLSSYIVDPKAEAQRQSDKAMNEAFKYIDKSAVLAGKAKEKLSKSNIQSQDTIVKGTEAFWKSQKEAAKRVLDSLTDVEAGSKKWSDAVKQYNEADKKLKLWDLDEQNRDEDQRAKKIKEAGDKLIRIAVDTENDINAAVAAAVEKGAEQKLEALNADYEKRVSTIEKRKRELEEIEKITGVPATAERDLLNQYGAALFDQYTSQSTTIKTEAAKIVKDIWADVNQKFESDLDNQITSTNQYYDKQLELLRKNIIDSQELKAAEAALEKARLKELDIIRINSALRVLDFQENISLRTQQLKDGDELFESKKQLNLLNIQREFAVKRKALLEASAQAGTPDLADDILEAQMRIEELDTALQDLSLGVLKEIGSYIKNIASGLSGVFSELSTELSDIFASVASNVDNIVTLLDPASNKSDRITAGISGLIQLAGMITSQIYENRLAQQAWTAAIRESEHQMTMLKLSAQAYEKSNLFGIENPYARAIAGAKQYSAAMIALKQAAVSLESGKVQTGTKKGVDVNNIYTGMGGGAAVGAAIGGILGGGVFSVATAAIGAAIGSAIGGLLGLFTKKTVPVFESLKKKYGEIYDKNTFELNPAILADYKKLDAATQKLVDNWSEIKEKAKEAQQQMRDTFSDLAGDIGNQLSQALINAFREGDIYAGIDDFHSYMTSKIEDIVGQLIFAAHFQQLFNDLEKRFNDSFADGGDGSIVDDLLWFSKQYKDGVAAFGNDLKTAKEQLAKEGIDIFSTEREREGAKKGIATASEETMSEVSGGIYALRYTTADIRNINRESLLVFKSIKSILDTIATNTGTAAERLNQIHNLLEDINSRGIKTRI
ncbi:MAG: hypothetical protein AB9922_07455 [Bacteroidales bacterium]